jgi:dipeptidyl aminopeptidase/acylaminoacyl peptidase
MAQPFDVTAHELEGDAFPIAENLRVGPSGVPFFSASNTGVLAFPIQETPGAQLVWFDRSGKPIEAVTEPDDYSNPRLSPDGRKIVVCIYNRQARARDLWIVDLERKSRAKATIDPADEVNPTWSADGSLIAFTSDRSGQRDVYQKPANGLGDEQLLFASSEAKSLSDWSPDGRLLLVHGPTAGISLIEVAFGKASLRPWHRTGSVSQNAQFSPDGRWIAYNSSETGRMEVYVGAASGTGGKVIVSRNGGVQPRWRRDGKEIFYIEPGDLLMAADVSTANATKFETRAVRRLFQVDFADALGSLYDVSADGQRFLVNTRVGEPIAPITVVLNWTAALNK